MAKIRLRKETGKLFFEFRFRGVRCREQTGLKDTKANRRRMQKVLDQIEADIVAQDFTYSKYFPDSKKVASFENPRDSKHPPSSRAHAVIVENELETPLFKEFCLIWMREQEVVWRRATREVQSLMLDKHILPVFGEKSLHQIDKPEILEFRAKLAEKRVKTTGKPLSPKTINEIVGTLKAILTEAADRYQFNSPCKNIKRLRVPRSDIHPFTLDEVSRLINECRPDYRSYFIVRLLTGMRTGEVHGLKWSRIDFDKRQILVRETFSKRRTEYTKNDGSQREIDMSPQVFSALKIQENASREISEYVFCNQAGQPIDNSNFLRSVWKPLLTHLELEPRRPYQCRHTAATLWLGAGENPQWIARQLGHTTTEMLFRTYARYVPNLTRKDGSAFERLMCGVFSDAEKREQKQ